MTNITINGEEFEDIDTESEKRIKKFPEAKTICIERTKTVNKWIQAFKKRFNREPNKDEISIFVTGFGSGYSSHQTRSRIIRYKEFSEVYNNLLDDLTIDIGKGENGYISFAHSWEAVKKFTLKLIEKKLNYLELKDKKMNAQNSEDKKE